MADLKLDLARKTCDKLDAWEQQFGSKILSESSSGISGIEGRVEPVPEANTEITRPLVLIVEDHPETNQYICETLSPAYRTQNAFDGKAGLEKATQLKPDLILVDLMMPKMCGAELVKGVRSQAELIAVPIIVLSATVDDGQRVQLLRGGVQDYVLKPFSPEELLARVDNLISLKHAREQLVERNERLQRLASKLEAANEELESFSYSVSHDLRAPLRRLESYSGLLESGYREQSDARARGLMDAIRKQTKQMERLIEDLLNFSRSGRQPMRSSSVDMMALCSAVFRELTAVSDRKPHLQLQSLPRALVDESLIRQVFVNLISNAIKFSRTRDSAVIKIGGHTEAGQNTYSVQDNGVGFDEKHGKKLFGVFQRLHGETEFEGTGIGLALVQRIVQRHNGRIWANSKVNEGATFHFTLPAAPEEK